MGEISADMNASSGFKRLSGASEWAQSAVCLVGAWTYVVSKCGKSFGLS